MPINGPEGLRSLSRIRGTVAERRAGGRWRHKIVAQRATATPCPSFYGGGLDTGGFVCRRAVARR